MQVVTAFEFIKNTRKLLQGCFGRNVFLQLAFRHTLEDLAGLWLRAETSGQGHSGYYQ